MTTRYYAVVIALVISLTSGLKLVSANNTRPWRLPFDGTVSITNAMNEGKHINASSEAIDYSAAGSQIAIRAPADGTVLNYLNVSDFGNVLRVSHANGVTSFFAHIASVNGVVAGTVVQAGQLIGWSGSTGTGGAGNHLHYEARVNAVAGSVYSGQSIPIRAVAGNWFNSFYSPLPDFHENTSLFSGGAQYPDQQEAPSTMSNQSIKNRHLWEIESPPDRPLFYTSNSTPTSVVLHTGGSPSTPNSNFDVSYSVQKYRLACGCYVASPGFYSASTTGRILNSADQADPNGQHWFVAYSYNTLRGWSTNNRYIDFMPEKPANNRPHIAAITDWGVQETILEYYVPGATSYTVYYQHGSTYSLVYFGPAPSTKVNRDLGGTSLYAVAAYNPQTGYTSASDWVIIKVGQLYGA